MRPSAMHSVCLLVYKNTAGYSASSSGTALPQWREKWVVVLQKEKDKLVGWASAFTVFEFEYRVHKLAEDMVQMQKL